MRKTFLVGALAAAAACQAMYAQNSPAPVAPAAPVAPSEVTPEQKAEYFRILGWNIGATMIRPQFSVLDMSEAERAEFLKGIALGVEGKDVETKEPLEKVASQLDGYLRGRAGEWERKNRDFLRQVDKIEGIQQSASGLRYIILEKGKSPMPSKDSTVNAIYKGTLYNGEVFDSTEKHRTKFDTFALNQVIAGWTEGLQKVGKGGKIRLYIPYEIGYGERGSPGGIPPYSTLIFDVEIVDVVSTPPTQSIPAPVAKPAQ
ncbi:MAG: FKBP-type peptidyl-prolyl cis-trans isomerase [Puniceicoccales bacterium]|jgi:FKBP-type peptidyl-prolyl cis-trans isomerase|nr:FKBP-type peptidyl-prolyl cis-trans isomerase [Puniceicoccales bacterium]